MFYNFGERIFETNIIYLIKLKNIGSLYKRLSFVKSGEKHNKFLFGIKKEVVEYYL